MLKDLLYESDTIPFFYKYLKEKGYSSQLIYQYVKSGWLDKIGPGVYKKRGKRLDPILIIKAMQEQLNKNLHIGAQSALFLLKKSHYIKFNNTYNIFYSNFRLNKWLTSLKYFDFIKSNIFKDNIQGFTKIENGPKISSLERAFIEMASLIPSNASFDEMIKTMELTPNLRSQLIQELLENCTSVKAKRLFLYTAETISHKWFNKLNIDKIDIGSGPRQIVKNGIYIKKYNIYIPRI